MATEWFYTSDGKGKSGPVSSGQLQALAKSGKLKPTDKVWKEGMAQWVPASRIKDLFASGVEAKKPQVAASTTPGDGKDQPQPRPTPEKFTKPSVADDGTEPSKERDGSGKVIGIVAVVAVTCIVCLAGVIVAGMLYMNSGTPEKVLAEVSETPEKALDLKDKGKGQQDGQPKLSPEIILEKSGLWRPYFAPNSNHIATHLTGEVTLFDADAGTQNNVYKNIRGFRGQCSTISPDGKYLAVSVNNILNASLDFHSATVA